MRTTGPILLYCVLAYAITWVCVSPLVAQGLGFYRGAIPPAWHALGALGPVVAALLAARLTGGPEALRTQISGMSRWRLPTGWWLVAAGSPFALLAVALAVVRLISGVWSDSGVLMAEVAGPGWWLEVAVAAVAFGLGEEPGWRGFLLPRLMRRHSALGATMILAVIWAAWHTPFFAYRFDFAGVATVAGFFVAMAAGACWLTFLYLSTNGSVPAVAVWHIGWNIVNLMAARMSDSVVGVLNGTMIVVALSVLLTPGRSLRWPARFQSRHS